MVRALLPRAVQTQTNSRRSPPPTLAAVVLDVALVVVGRPSRARASLGTSFRQELLSLLRATLGCF